MDKRINQIRYFVVDVDGTLTDGGLYYDSFGNEIKKFCTRDAAGFLAAHAVGLKTIVVTGRCCIATKRRLSELPVDYVFQNVENKLCFLKRFCEEKSISFIELAYIGDDLNDLAGMNIAGYVACPLDACNEVKSIADYISKKRGGEGAVRDIIEHFLIERGDWNEAVNRAYNLS